jgi:hypothetical protein
MTDRERARQCWQCSDNQSPRERALLNRRNRPRTREYSSKECQDRSEAVEQQGERRR